MCLTLVLDVTVRVLSLTGDTTAKLALNFQDTVKLHRKLHFTWDLSIYTQQVTSISCACDI